MSESNPLSPLIIILGPTAVGKTQISLQAAEKINGEIISVDSRLFYRGMDIGTAKPSPKELSRVPHHLVDVAEPDENWSLARFQNQAKEIIKDIQDRGKMPVCVGGSGQYIRALTEGWDIPEIQEDLDLRNALNRWADEIGREALHQRLEVLDLAAAGRIDPRNLRRTVRALEVVLRTGKLFSEQRSRQPIPYRVLQIGLTRPKEKLFARIDARVDAMMEGGFLEEVQALLEKYPPNLRSFSAIGYQQLIAHLEGEMNLEEAVEEIKRQTKKFVRRQYTWFKMDDPAIHWSEMGENTLEDITQKVNDFLSR